MFHDQLVHRAEIRRLADKSRRDRMGQPVQRYTTIASNVPCRASARGRTQGRGGERNSERMRETYESTLRVFFAADVDIHEDDVLIVRDISGNLILPEARITLKWLAHGAGNDPHHIEVDVESLRGPQ